jgi:D-alanyl-D-alanine carboxypeptidase/D-alanyl-D-alanine-endopeptidase (penicillin-binding protein 4)
VPDGQANHVEVHASGPHSFTGRGQIARSSAPLLRFLSVEDPTAFARGLFLEALQGARVRLLAHQDRSTPAPLPPASAYPTMTRVAAYSSPPLSELVKVMLKASPNLYGDTLPLLLAARRGKTGMADGLREMRQVLSRMGVNLSGVALATAGGGRGNLLTPRATVELLQVLSQRPEWPLFEAALPVLGVDGTLADAVPLNSPARGKVHAKTGTSYLIDQYGCGILESKALAGTLTTARGRPLFFAVFLNNVPLPPGVNAEREGRRLGRLCEVLYQDTP